MSVVDQDKLRVSMNFELPDGTQYQNVFHMIRDGEDAYSVQAHLDAIEVKMELAYADIQEQVAADTVAQLCFVDRVEFNEVVDEWRIVENVGTFTPLFEPSVYVEGLPFQCAPYTYFKTQRPRTVGKKFWFPFLETAQSETVLVAGAVTDLVAMAVELLTPIALGGDATLTLGVPRTGIGVWYNFLVAVVSDLLGTQRRRKPGVGA